MGTARVDCLSLHAVDVTSTPLWQMLGKEVVVDKATDQWYVSQEKNL